MWSLDGYVFFSPHSPAFSKGPGAWLKIDGSPTLFWFSHVYFPASKCVISPPARTSSEAARARMGPPSPSRPLGQKVGEALAHQFFGVKKPRTSPSGLMCKREEVQRGFSKKGARARLLEARLRQLHCVIPRLFLLKDSNEVLMGMADLGITEWYSFRNHEEELLALTHWWGIFTSKPISKAECVTSYTPCPLARQPFICCLNIGNHP